MTLFTEDDLPRIRSIANVVKISGCEVPDWMLAIKPVSGVASSCCEQFYLFCSMVISVLDAEVNLLYLVVNYNRNSTQLE